MRMLARSYGVRIALAVMAISAAGCGTEAILGPLVAITNQWYVPGTNPPRSHVFQLDNTKGGEEIVEREGTFTGTETTPAGVSSDLTGFWTSNGRVEFTVRRETGDVTFSGTFTSPKRMELTSAEGPLVLIRD